MRPRPRSSYTDESRGLTGFIYDEAQSEEPAAVPSDAPEASGEIGMQYFGRPMSLAGSSRVIPPTAVPPPDFWAHRNLREPDGGGGGEFAGGGADWRDFEAAGADSGGLRPNAAPAAESAAPAAPTATAAAAAAHRRMLDEVVAFLHSKNRATSGLRPDFLDRETVCNVIAYLFMLVSPLPSGFVDGFASHANSISELVFALRVPAGPLIGLAIEYSSRGLDSDTHGSVVEALHWMVETVKLAEQRGLARAGADADADLSAGADADADHSSTDSNTFVMDPALPPLASLERYVRHIEATTWDGFVLSDAGSAGSAGNAAFPDAGDARVASMAGPVRLAVQTLRDAHRQLVAARREAAAALQRESAAKEQRVAAAAAEWRDARARFVARRDAARAQRQQLATAAQEADRLNYEVAELGARLDALNARREAAQRECAALESEAAPVCSEAGGVSVGEALAWLDALPEMRARRATLQKQAAEDEVRLAAGTQEARRCHTALAAALARHSMSLRLSAASEPALFALTADDGAEGGSGGSGSGGNGSGNGGSGSSDEGQPPAPPLASSQLLSQLLLGAHLDAPFEDVRALPLPLISDAEARAVRGRMQRLERAVDEQQQRWAAARGRLETEAAKLAADAAFLRERAGQLADELEDVRDRRERRAREAADAKFRSRELAEDARLSGGLVQKLASEHARLDAARGALEAALEEKQLLVAASQLRVHPMEFIYGEYEYLCHNIAANINSFRTKIGAEISTEQIMSYAETISACVDAAERAPAVSTAPPPGTKRDAWVRREVARLTHAHAEGHTR